MPVALIDHKEDPKERIIRAAGDLDDFEIFNNQVLLGLYVRGDENQLAKTKGGVYIPTKEDDFQSKSGIILKMGPVAFVDKNTPQRWFIDQDDMDVGDAVCFRTNSGFPITLVSEHRGQKVELLCRMMIDEYILGRSTGKMGLDRFY
jgi:co-chaperonin GroES (HSP10)